ncbi:hypothetical protein HOLleu_13805 [Holothuria leucospilota]|uniref:Uncharacterized protein n=1 Tax=Holothuria leucospilota TaxID=206669 RepID=A0A9Q1C7B4_HOLLE|nr:hypothetical protein HOLleu_13805 [Holothuria leucospilota]
MVLSDVICVSFLMFMSQFALTCWGQRQCLGCISEKFLNSDFSNWDVFEDTACVKGVNLTDEYRITCEQSEVCFVIDGIASYYVQGFGLTDTKLVLRNCIDSSHFTSPFTCLRDNDANTFVKRLNLQLEIGDDVSLSSFAGTVCPCQDEAYCNDQAIAPVFVRRHHTPAPKARGLQCVRCVDTDFPFGLSHYDYDNPSCEAGNLTHSDVFYHTCSGDGACVIIDGFVTDDELDVSYTLYLRGCVHGLLDSYRSSDSLRCLSRSESAMAVPGILLSEEDYYVGYDLTFEGRMCYCTSDFCTLPGRAQRPTTEQPETDKPSIVTPVSVAVAVLLLVAVIAFVFFAKIYRTLVNK